MALAATLGSSGSLASYETIVLITPAEVDAAMKMAIDCRSPGS